LWGNFGAQGIAVEEISTWNEFQGATRGMFASRQEAGIAWRLYRSTAQSRVFWSGGAAAEDAAEAWARLNRGSTLGMTEPAMNLANETRELDWYLEARPRWQAASRGFALGASGDVHVFQSARGISLESIWRDEFYALLRNPSVNRIVYHVVMPDGEVIIVP
jgi:hypothetical protein